MLNVPTNSKKNISSFLVFNSFDIEFPSPTWISVRKECCSCGFIFLFLLLLLCSFGNTSQRIFHSFFHLQSHLLSLVAACCSCIRVYFYAFDHLSSTSSNGFSQTCSVNFIIQFVALEVDFRAKIDSNIFYQNSPKKSKKYYVQKFLNYFSLLNSIFEIMKNDEKNFRTKTDCHKIE